MGNADEGNACICGSDSGRRDRKRLRDADLCLPWGIGAALGAMGLSVFFVRFQIWFLALSVLLLFGGFFQVLHKGSSCKRRSRVEIILLGIAAVVVIGIVLFPQWVAGLLVGHLP
jgi:hypothetical protein